jgi:hypothetical protein
VTEYIGFEDETLIRCKLPCPLYSREWHLEELSYRLLGVTRFHTILHDSVLHIEVEVTLTNIVCWSSRTDKHHHFVVPLLTLFIWLSLINLCGVVRNNALWKVGTVGVVMISIRKPRTITWNGFLPPIGLVVPNGIGVTIVVTYTGGGTPTLICKFPFRTTQR